MNRLKSVSVIFLLWLGSCSCINTSYSRFDEIEITNNEVYLVLGAFAHHGPDFYEAEEVRAKKVLKEKPQDFAARNDLASAYIKLGHYKAAESEFNRNEEDHPGRYETASNRGVLYKKWGKYEQSAKYLRQSFVIKPGGHMGLGDYYLKMVEWLDQTKDAEVGLDDVTHDFLGRAYVDYESSTLPKANKEHLLTLIKNDYNFADSYAVLGQVYEAEGDLQMAMRCYNRAGNLDHKSRFIASSSGRVSSILEQTVKAGQVYDGGGAFDQLSGELRQSEEWLVDYQELESDRLSDGLPVDFKTMKGVLDDEGIEKPIIIEAAVFEGEEVEDSLITRYKVSGGVLTFFIMLFIPACLIGVLAIYLVCRSKQKFAQPPEL